MQVRRRCGFFAWVDATSSSMQPSMKSLSTRSNGEGQSTDQKRNTEERLNYLETWLLLLKKD